MWEQVKVSVIIRHVQQSFTSCGLNTDKKNSFQLMADILGHFHTGS